MADRPLITANPQLPLINAVSMEASITGAPTNINRLPGLSYDLSWTGDPTGVFVVQVSNSYQQGPQGEVLKAGVWHDLPTASFIGTYPVPSGSSGNGFLDVVGTEAAWVRLVYTRTSGSGNLTVIPAAKVW